MSEEILDTNPEEEEENKLIAKNDLIALKLKADSMKLKYHPNIGLGKLQIKIDDAIKLKEKEQTKSETVEEEVSALLEGLSVEELEAMLRKKQPVNPAAIVSSKPFERGIESLAMRRQRVIKECSKLVRVNVTTRNPLKKNWQSEILKSGNDLVGSFTKCIVFSKPYHIPQIILNTMKESQYQAFKTVRMGNGMETQKGYLTEEYVIEYLNPLNKVELEDLQRSQSVSKNAED